MKEKITELLISGVCLLAVELGGFDIQVEPGEMKEPPSGWEQDGTDGGMLEAEEGTNGGISGDQVSESLWNSSQIKGEQDGTQEQSPGERESFGDVWNTSEEDGDSGYEEENISGESSPDWNPGESSADSGRSVYDEYDDTEPEQDDESNRNNGGESGSIQGNPHAGTEPSGEQIQEEAKKEKTPEPSFSPTPFSPTPVLSNPAGTEYSKENRSGKNDSGEKAAAPDILYLTGRTEKTARLRLRLNTKGEVQVLSFRVNGKEQTWRWQGDCLTTDTDTEKGSLVEIALFTDCSWTLPENRAILSCNTEIS